MIIFFLFGLFFLSALLGSFCLGLLIFLFNLLDYPVLKLSLVHRAHLLLCGWFLHLSMHEDVTLLVEKRGIHVFVNLLWINELGNKLFLPFFCLTFSEVGDYFLSWLDFLTLSSLEIP